MTPGRAAELWRRPIKLFAFDLILSFLPPRWMSTGEHREEKKNTHTHIYMSVLSYIALLLALSTYAISVSFLSNTDLRTYASYIPFSHNLTLAPALSPSQWNTQNQKEKKNHKNKREKNPKAYFREDDDGTIMWKQSCLLPRLHTKWLSGTINFTPAVSHNFWLFPKLKEACGPGGSVETHLLTYVLCLYLIDVEWRVVFKMAVICQVLIIHSHLRKHNKKNAQEAHTLLRWIVQSNIHLRGESYSSHSFQSVF